MDRNPLVRDRDVAFLLDEVLELDALLALPAFAEHSRETCDLVLIGAARFARDVLYPTYRSVDESPPRFENGRVRVHERLRAVYPELSQLGLVVAARPPDVGGVGLPFVVSTLASAYLMAANLSAYGYVGLSAGAAHLLEVFGDARLHAEYMAPIYEGRWTGTMALTEPGAGSSLADVATLAARAEDGSYRLRGAKIFISGGDHDLAENIVHMVLARIDDPTTPPGTRGVSLFCVPKRRVTGGGLVDNDVAVTGVIHKIGWRGLPSVALAFGERGDCHGYLVGEPHRGLAAMFQMINEARIMVGVNGFATASVAFHESLAYARVRRQGRAPTAKDPTTPQLPIIRHADVRRMLLRQKAIVEGSLALLARTAMLVDRAEHGATDVERARAKRLLDLLTPIAKSFPAERGFESNVLALQIHGGYGYSSEYPLEAWLRDQKLNSLHEGTTGIQALDLLGRKVMADGGAALALLSEEIEAAVGAARRAGLARWADALALSVRALASLTAELGARGASGDVSRMLLHATEYLDAFGVVVVAWQHLAMATAALAKPGRDEEDSAYRAGKVRAMEYWLETELPRAESTMAVVRAGGEAFTAIDDTAF